MTVARPVRLVPAPVRLKVRLDRPQNRSQLAPDCFRSIRLRACQIAVCGLQAAIAKPPFCDCRSGGCGFESRPPRLKTALGASPGAFLLVGLVGLARDVTLFAGLPWLGAARGQCVRSTRRVLGGPLADAPCSSEFLAADLRREAGHLAGVISFKHTISNGCAEPLRRAWDMGYATGLLEASEMSAPVYARLGFRTLGHMALLARVPALS